MRVHVLALAAVVLTAGGSVRADDAAKEWARLNGTWKVVEKAGKVDYLWGYVSKRGWVVVSDGKATLVLREDGKETKLAEFAVTIDSSKSPKSVVLTIDYLAPEGDKDRAKGTKLVGVYALDGDTLKFAVGEEKAPPKGFPEKGDEGVTTLTRVKAK